MSDHKVFPNGSSFMFWRDENCDRCRKDYVANPKNHGGNPLCKIEEAISLSSVMDGRFPSKVREAIEQRLKWDGATYLNHNCPEFEERK